MGVMDKFINAMKLNDEEDDYYDDDYYDEPEPARKSSPIKEDITTEEEKPVKKTIPKVTSMRPMKKMMDSGMEVCVIRPTTVEDAREITETLLMNRPVILNVEGLDVDIAQRIIDFTSGSCFAINGNLQPVSKYIFIVTPANIDISGDVQSWLDSSYGSTESLRMDFS